MTRKSVYPDNETAKNCRVYPQRGNPTSVASVNKTMEAQDSNCNSNVSVEKPKWLRNKLANHW